MTIEITHGGLNLSIDFSVKGGGNEIIIHDIVDVDDDTPLDWELDFDGLEKLEIEKQCFDYWSDSPPYRRRDDD